MVDTELIKTTFELLVSSGVAVTGWKWLENFYNKKKTEKATKALSNMALIYDQLNLLATELNCGRCMLVYTSNGGGIPSVAKNIYFTALYEVKDQHADSIRSFYQNVLVDEEHSILLNRLLKNSFLVEKPENLKDSFLKSSYEFQEVEEFAYFEVLRTPERYYYLTLSWHDISRVPDLSDLKTLCTACSANIKTILARG